MITLIKTLIIILAIYIFFKMATRALIAFFLRKLGNVEKQYQFGKQGSNDNTASNTEETDGETKKNASGSSTTPRKAGSFKGGDYIDYEEMR